jgi:hypothetical protein
MTDRHREIEERLKAGTYSALDNRPLTAPIPSRLTYDPVPMQVEIEESDELPGRFYLLVRSEQIDRTVYADVLGREYAEILAHAPSDLAFLLAENARLRAAIQQFALQDRINPDSHDWIDAKRKVFAALSSEEQEGKGT